MIPKIIHYCWFGHNTLPKLANKCINSWKNFLPDYTIKRWDESNFDIHCCPYVEEAYQAKKWAFVSDYARFYILYKDGDVYFDTDVELIKPLDNLISYGGFIVLLICQLHVTFVQRWIIFSAILDIPLLMRLLQEENRRNRHQVKQFVIASCLLTFAFVCSRGNLCSLKFWE